jgi:hypothetical protein
MLPEIPRNKEHIMTAVENVMKTALGPRLWRNNIRIAVYRTTAIRARKIRIKFLETVALVMTHTSQDEV